MRKIDKKNKISFNLFGLIILLFLAGFAFVAFRVLGADKESYELAKGSTIYDEDVQIIDVASTGTIEKMWNGKYYLSMDNAGSYCLGEQSVSYDAGVRQVDVYGKGYQVFTDGSVQNISKKTEIGRDAEVRVFKLADRHYLLTGNDIRCDEQSFQTENYLEIHINKDGNALLTNDAVNMKTVEPMVLTCGELSLDIANEQLGYADQIVDLKAIGGSTNEYMPDEKTGDEENNEENNKEGDTPGSSVVNNNSSSSSSSNTNNTTNQQNVIIQGGGGTGVIGGGTGTDSGTGDGTGTGTGTGNGSGSSIPANLERSITLRGTESDVTSIQVNYSIVDVENKFVSTYLLVQEAGTEDEEDITRVELNKADNSVSVRDLEPNTQYQISLCYEMYVKEDGQNVLIENTQNVVKARTRAVKSDIQLDKLTAKSMTVTVTLDSNYILDCADLVLYADSNEPVTVPVSISQACRGGWTTTIALSSDMAQAEKYTLKLENAMYQGESISLNAEYITKNSLLTRVVNTILSGF